MSWFDVVRVVLISGNIAFFAGLSFVSLTRALRSSPSGSRRVRVASGAAFGAVAVGGFQRLVLQGIHLGVVPSTVTGAVLEGQAVIQSVVVAALGAWAWWSLRAAEQDVMTAESLLAAFEVGIGDIDWSNIRITRRQAEVLTLISRGILTDGHLAQELGVSVETVRSHVKAVMKAVGVSTRIELAVAVHQEMGALRRRGHPSGLGFSPGSITENPRQGN